MVNAELPSAARSALLIDETEAVAFEARAQAINSLIIRFRLTKMTQKSTIKGGMRCFTQRISKLYR